MSSPIDWEKQYILLENQLREMMKMSFKLMSDENTLQFKNLIVEEYDKQIYVTVIVNGDSPVFKYDCFDDNDNLIYNVTDTYRNSINITEYESITKISVFVKNNFDSKYIQNKIVNLY